MENVKKGKRGVFGDGKWEGREASVGKCFGEMKRIWRKNDGKWREGSGRRMEAGEGSLKGICR